MISIQTYINGNQSLLFSCREGWGMIPKSARQAAEASQILPTLKCSQEYLDWLDIYSPYPISTFKVNKPTQQTFL